jgi:hypothetical protein
MENTSLTELVAEKVSVVPGRSFVLFGNCVSDPHICSRKPQSRVPIDWATEVIARLVIMRFQMRVEQRTAIDGRVR